MAPRRRNGWVEQAEVRECDRCGAVALHTGQNGPYYRSWCDVCGHQKEGVVCDVSMLGEVADANLEPVRAVVRWSGRQATAAEIRALRRLWPDFANRPLAALAHELRRSPEVEVDLGVIFGSEVHELVKRGAAFWLHVEIRPT